MPRYPLPVLRLARLAVDEAFQGRGLGRRLAAYAFAVALQVRAAAGCIGVVVDALPNRVGFYADLGFVELELTSGQSPLRPRPVAMFLPLSSVEAALASSPMTPRDPSVDWVGQVQYSWLGGTAGPLEHGETVHNAFFDRDFEE